MVKTAGLYVVPIKSYSKNGNLPFILDRIIVSVSIKSDKPTAHVSPPPPIYFVNNFSKKVLTNDEYESLANGLDFAYLSSGINEESFIGNIESYFINLMVYVTDKPITYKMTPDQLLCASKLRSAYEKFRFNTREKSKKTSISV
jgi:hypothetical protein